MSFQIVTFVADLAIGVKCKSPRTIRARGFSSRSQMKILTFFSPAFLIN